MDRIMKPFPLWLPFLLTAACSTDTTARLRLSAPQTVPRVELSRYLGDWYEIASFPQSFQRGCTASMASYALRADGDIDVVNRCRNGSPTGPEKVARGRARVVDKASNAKLEVSFFRPFWGDYWIIDLGVNYEFAVVGHPSRDYLWILARERRLEPSVYAAILARLAAQGYETHRLVRTIVMGTLGGFPNPPAMVRAEQSSAAPHAFTSPAPAGTL
jgi:apolipoprotein D and lipocalin family protein